MNSTLKFILVSTLALTLIGCGSDGQNGGAGSGGSGGDGDELREKSSVPLLPQIDKLREAITISLSIGCQVQVPRNSDPLAIALHGGDRTQLNVERPSCSEWIARALGEVLGCPEPQEGEAVLWRRSADAGQRWKIAPKGADPTVLGRHLRVRRGKTLDEAGGSRLMQSLEVLCADPQLGPGTPG
jgi:hypothetical protein